jgi:hypothetical protein
MATTAERSRTILTTHWAENEAEAHTPTRTQISFHRQSPLHRSNYIYQQSATKFE